MKTLVVYFSRTGQASLTARVAKEIAKQCDAHVDMIQPQSQRDSWFSAWRYGWQSLTHAEPAIRKAAHNPSNYDLIVIGVPVSRAGLAPPVRSYLRRYGGQIQQLAFFCAEGSGGEDRAFSELTKLYGRPPVATFGVARKHLSAIADREQLNDFVGSLRGGLTEE